MLSTDLQTLSYIYLEYLEDWFLGPLNSKLIEDSLQKAVLYRLDDTAGYAGLLLGPAEGSLWPSAEAFFALWAKKRILLCCFSPFLAFFGVFWCPVVPLVTFSRNLSNFERNPKKPKKIFLKILKFQKIQNF